MSQDYTQKIRALEALALRPGTLEEGEVARSRAIELSQKYNIPSIFTQEGYVPPAPKKEPVVPKPKTLHKNALNLEFRMHQFGWTFSHFNNGERIYLNHQRPDEEIRMAAHMFGEFSCIHIFKPIRKVRAAGSTPDELSHFFNSVTYRHELWPKQKSRQESYSYSNFYDPLFDTFKKEEPTPQPEPVKPIVEEVKKPEPPPPEPVDPAIEEAIRRIDEIDELLNSQPPSSDTDPLEYVRL